MTAKFRSNDRPDFFSIHSSSVQLDPLGELLDFLCKFVSLRFYNQIDFIPPFSFIPEEGKTKKTKNVFFAFSKVDDTSISFSDRYSRMSFGAEPTRGLYTTVNCNIDLLSYQHLLKVFENNGLKLEITPTHEIQAENKEGGHAV